MRKNLGCLLFLFLTLSPFSSRSQEIEDKENLANALKLSAQKAFFEGDYHTAARRWQQSLTLYQELKDDKNVGRILTNLGITYGRLSEFDKAFSSFQQATQVLERTGDQPGLINALINEARTYSNIAAYQEVLSSYEKALSISIKTGDRENQAQILAGLGNTYYHLNAFPKALFHYQQSLTIRRDSHDRWGEAKVLSYIGVLYYYWGFPDSSLAYFEKALEIQKAIRDETGLRDNFSNLGVVHYSQDRFTKAASSYENALKLQRKLGDQTGEAKSLLSLGDVYYNLGKFDNALSWYQDAHKIYNQIQDKLGQTESLRKIGGIHLTMNKFEAALDYYKKALQLATTIKDPENIWKSNYGLGLVLKRQGMKEAAVKYFRDAIEAIETIKGKRSFFQTEKEFIKNELDVYLETIETLLELHVKHPHLEYHQSAFEYLERMIARKLQNIFFSIETRHYDPIVQEQLTTFRSNVLQEGNLSKLLVDEKALPEAKQDQKKIANLNQYLSRIRDNLRSDQTKLRKSCPRLETLLSVRPVPVRRIQDHLSKEQALIEYLPLENQLYIFLISQTNFSVKQVTLKKEELWKQVKSFREEMDRTRQKWQEKGAIPEVRSWNELRFSSLKTTLTRMYDYLIKPLEADLHNYQNLIIIPTGLLSYFPFQALAQETKKGKLTFLIQDKDIQYWTYANRLTFKAKDPSFKNPQVLMLTENSQSIAKEVGEIFKRTTSYWGSEATEAKLKQPSGAFQILHLAVPGFLDHKYPEESFLQLAPEESSGNDGKLGLSEILEIPLMDASLVVLPAVETTVTEESSGIELTYFVETLGMAGADRVVLTQWPGPAFGTEEVIKKFYKALKNSRPEEALRKTQVSLLRNHQLAHPVCWAPFVLYEY